MSFVEKQNFYNWSTWLGEGFDDGGGGNLWQLKRRPMHATNDTATLSLWR